MTRRTLLVALLIALVTILAGLDSAVAQTYRWKAVATSRPTPQFGLWNEDKLGGVVLGGYLWPHQVIYSRKPIRSPADLRGLKVRVYGTAQTEFSRALGLEPVSIPFAEVYTALERGTVDAGFTIP